MSIGGSKSKQSSETSVNLPPWLDQEWQSAINDATAFSQQPFQGYTGQMTAGTNSLQQSAAGHTANALNGSSPGFQQAQGVMGQLAGGYQPANVSAPTINPITGQAVTGNAVTGQATMGQATTGAATDINRGAVSNVAAGNVKNVSDYFNPYENSVVNQTMADISRQADIAGNAARARSAAAGSFGGSRSAILEGETQRPYVEAMAREAANLRNSGYAQAQNVAGQDANRGLQAGMANQQADLSVAGQNAAARNSMTQANLGFQNQFGLNNMNAANSFGMANMDAQNQYGLANMGAQNAMNTTNLGFANTAANNNASLNMQGQLANQSAGLQGANLRLNAAQNLATSGQNEQQGKLAFIQQLAQQGNLEQLTSQADLDARYNEFLRGQQQPIDMFNLRLSALGLAPYNNNTKSSGSSSTGSFGLKLLG